MDALPVHNAEFDWDRFDAESYKNHNYGHLRADDRCILELVRDHFAATVRRTGLRGIDVGAGPNLYPSLSMLPFCDTVRLYEFSASNVTWLRDQVRAHDASWKEFWEVLTVNPAYRGIDPDRRLATVAEVVQGSVFDLPAEPSWDVATMFFVAESLTRDVEEFRESVRRVVAALAPGGSFAMAFMKDSSGYTVEGEVYPAVSLDRSALDDCFGRLPVSYQLHEVDVVERFREGYGGMIVVTGTVDEP